MEVAAHPPGPFQDTPAGPTSADSSGESKVAGIGDYLQWLWPRSAPPTQESKPKLVQGDRSSGYPTKEDAEFARKYDYAYGQTWEPFFNNLTAVVLGEEKKGKFTPKGYADYKNDDELFASQGKTLDLSLSKNAAIKEELKDVFARAALATNRSALATLGFAPSQTMMDVVKYAKSNHPPIGGEYDFPKDKKEYEQQVATQRNVIYSNLYIHDAIVHESIHKGIEMLRQRRPEETKAALKLLGLEMNEDDEQIPRRIVQSVMGNYEKGKGDYGDKQIENARFDFESGVNRTNMNKGLQMLEALAAEEVAKKRPGGPR